MAGERPSIIAVISDLGTRDPAVAQFRSAVYSVNTNVRFVDVTHEIRPRDLLEAAFTLHRVFRQFPTRTIFVVLVEGQLGAPRRPLLAVSMDYYYFAPDNGVLSFVYEADSISTVQHVTAEHYVKLPPRPLAPHRDTYGMAAAWLAKGIESANFGDPVNDYVRTALPKAGRPKPNELHGIVLHVDRFGSLVSNIHEDEINVVRQSVGTQQPFRVVLGDKSVPVVAGFAEGGPDTLAMYGSSGHLEIISAKGDASKNLGAKRGDPLAVVFGA